MTVTEILDSVVAWCNENICPQLLLKCPPEDQRGNREQIDHKVKFVNPTAFALFVPGKDRLPPNVTTAIPSICVQLMEGHDRPVERKRVVSLRLCLAAYNPGTQSEEVFYPHVDESLDIPRRFRQGEEGKEFYHRNFDGWRDVWNFVDKTLKVLEDSPSITKGLSLVRDEGIKYGPFQEEGTVWDFYPYWHSWISFKLEGELVNAIPQDLHEYL